MLYKVNDENVVHFFFEKPGFPSGNFKKVGYNVNVVEGANVRICCLYIFTSLQLTCIVRLLT